jgi:CRISP-associated protein Cas1
MQLVLDTHGLVLKQRNRAFEVIGKQASRLISPKQITSIAVTADCLVSTAAIRLAVKHHVPIFLIDNTGQVEGRLWSAHFIGLASLRRSQANWVDEGHWVAWIYQCIAQKLTRQAQVIQEHSHMAMAILAAIPLKDEIMKPIDGINDAPEAVDGKRIRQLLLSAEAKAAKLYWTALSAALPVEWQFQGRSRRPAQDPFNCTLNYAYGMLYQVVENAVFAAGLDPYIGVLHAEEYARPALVFDLIEPFRPWIDELLLYAFLQQIVKDNFFEQKENGWWMSKAGKAWLIPAFNTWMDEFIILEKVKKSRKNHIYTAAGQLANRIKATYPIINPEESNTDIEGV